MCLVGANHLRRDSNEAKDDMTEEQWRQAWEEFWAAAGEPPESDQQ